MSAVLGRALTLTCLLPAAAAAQKVIWQKVGKMDEEALSTPLAFFGDCDRDGYDDLVCLVRTYRPPSNEPDNEIYVISGKDGSTLRAVRSPRDATTQYFHMGLTRAGDVDADGYPDYAAHRYDNKGNGPTAVDVRSGRDDRVIWTVHGLQWGFTSPLLGDVDLNGDRRPDLVIKGYSDAAGWALYAYDHAGRWMYRLPYETCSLGRIGDLDGDGCEDVVVGSCGDEPGGWVSVISGRTGKAFVTGWGELPGDNLGTGMVTGCGDVDGDNVRAARC